MSGMTRTIMDTPPDMAVKDVETTILKRYIEEAMRAKRAETPTELARKAKLAPSTLLRMLQADGPRHTPRRETLRSLEKSSGVPLPPELASLVRGADDREATPDTDTEADIAVLGMVGTSLEGRFYLNREPFEWTPRLPGLARRKRVFALRMPDDSMSPWRLPNELVFVDPIWAVSDGCHVLVKMANADDPDAEDLYSIRRFVGRSRADRSVILEAYNSPTEAEAVPRTKILGMQRVVEWAEAAGGR